MKLNSRKCLSFLFYQLHSFKIIMFIPVTFTPALLLILLFLKTSSFSCSNPIRKSGLKIEFFSSTSAIPNSCQIFDNVLWDGSTTFYMIFLIVSFSFCVIKPIGLERTFNAVPSTPRQTRRYVVCTSR